MSSDRTRAARRLAHRYSTLLQRRMYDGMVCAFVARHDVQPLDAAAVRASMLQVASEVVASTTADDLALGEDA